MSADFADPHWAFVWPAYGAGVLIVGGLAVFAWRRARYWAERLAEAEAAQAAPKPEPVE